MAKAVEIRVRDSMPRPLRLPRRIGLVARLALRKPLGAIGAVIVVALILMAVFADHIAPYAYDHTIAGARMKPPSAQYWMGTDNLARDIWSRVVYGARI